MGRSANFSLLKSSCFSLLLGKLKFALLKWRTRQLNLDGALPCKVSFDQSQTYFPLTPALSLDGEGADSLAPLGRGSG